MKRSLLLTVSLLVLAGCATQSSSHYSVVPGVRVIERAPKKVVSHVPVVASGSAGAVR
jgi:uncharacterized lipoprotein YajG